MSQVKNLILILFFLFQVTPLNAANQPMGILKGTYSFVDNLAEIPAYCLDYFANSPDESAQYISFDTRVKITTSKGMQENTLDYFVEEGVINASGLSDEAGEGQHNILKFEKGINGDDLIQIEILNHAVARERGYNKYSHDYLIEVFQRDVIDHLSPDVLQNPRHNLEDQQRLWKKQSHLFSNSGMQGIIERKLLKDLGDEHLLHLIEEKGLVPPLKNQVEIAAKKNKRNIPFEAQKSTISDTYTIGKQGFDLNNNLTINYLHLEGGGNSFIIKTPAKELLIFDTGKVKYDAKKIKELIQEYGGEIESVKMFVTHTDADHINGLKRWLKEGVQIKEIVISNVDRVGHGRDQLEKFRKIIGDKKGYQEEIIGEGELIRFTSGENTSGVKFEEIIQSSEKVKSYRVDLNESADRMIFHKYINGANVNDLSIMSKIEHEGVSHFSMGDVGVVAIKNLLEENNIQQSILQEKLDDLLAKIQEADLDFVELEFTPSKSDLQEFAKLDVIALTAEKLGNQFNLGEMGNVKRLADLNSRLFLRPGENATRINLAKSFEDYIDEKLIIKNDVIESSVNDIVEVYNKKISEHNELLNNRNELVTEYNTLLAKSEDLSLESTVLQWPHHWWLPDLNIASNKATLDRLLQTVSPQYLIISKPPNGVKQNLDNLLNYLDGFKKEHGATFEIKELSGQNFEIISELQKIRMGKAPFEIG